MRGGKQTPVCSRTVHSSTVMQHLNQHYGQKWTDHPKSENVKVETEIKEKLNRISKK